MAVAARTTDFSFAKLIGPGLLVAATGIGAGDIVSATMGGASHGLTILWAVVLAAFLKSFLNEGIARWQLATDTTALEGWCTYLPWWVRAYFGVYLLFWIVSVSAALTSASGLWIATLSNGTIPASWGAVLHSLVGCGFVLIGGFKGFEKAMSVLIATMFFSMVACAALTFREPLAVLRGLAVPAIPAGGGSSVLSVLGGIGGSIAMLAYNYWLREEKMVGPQWMRYVRADITIAYVFTALFGLSVMIIANQAFHVPAVRITNAQAVTKMAETLGAIIGPVGFYAFAVGFWAAVFASLLGIWQSIPYLVADFYGLLRKYPRSVRERLTQVGSTPYRVGLVFITLVPMPFAFLGQPLFLIRTFTIIGSLFIPFLAATLLYLNNFRMPTDGGVPRNSTLTNVVLAVALALFVVVGAREAGLLAR
ncbi:MAG: Nramp family divalent metal transporter [Gemmatimonadetes bacterium]|nr:Nramp family divalent metal transporter [Gemmatimonadota bacterium]